MRIEISREAAEDLVNGYDFYEEQQPGIGSYFLDSLYSDIDALLLYAGIHRMVFGKHRALSKRFPFAIYYRLDGEVIRVDAVLDCRRKPSWIRRRLRKK